MADNGDSIFGDHDGTATTTTTETPTTHFMISENDSDAADMVLKRVLYTIYLWIYRLLSLLVGTTFLSVLLLVPILVFLCYVQMDTRRILGKANVYVYGGAMQKALKEKEEMRKKKEADKRRKEGLALENEAKMRRARMRK
jgi:hypothetical protein